MSDDDRSFVEQGEAIRVEVTIASCRSQRTMTKIITTALLRNAYDPLFVARLVLEDAQQLIVDAGRDVPE